MVYSWQLFSDQVELIGFGFAEVTATSNAKVNWGTTVRKWNPFRNYPSTSICYDKFVAGLRKVSLLSFHSRATPPQKFSYQKHTSTHSKKPNNNKEIIRRAGGKTPQMIDWIKVTSTKDDRIFFLISNDRSALPLGNDSILLPELRELLLFVFFPPNESKRQQKIIKTTRGVG